MFKIVQRSTDSNLHIAGLNKRVTYFCSDGFDISDLYKNITIHNHNRNVIHES